MSRDVQVFMMPPCPMLSIQHTDDPHHITSHVIPSSVPPHASTSPAPI